MKTLALLLASAAFSLLGCGGSSSSSISSPDGGDGGGGGKTAAQAAADLGNAYCARIAACAPAYASAGFGQVSTCESRFQLDILPVFTAPGTSITVSQAEACASALPGASCGDLLGRQMPSACQTLPGTLANGAACGADSQCVGTRCKVAADAVCGICTSPAPAGAACAVDGDCQPAMTCINDACILYGVQGSQCSATAPCRADFGCIGGQCTTPAAVGAPCTGDGQCDELSGAFCDGFTKTCVNVTFAQPGGVCGLVDGGLASCEGPGGTCTGTAAPTYQGTCQGFAADGTGCSTDGGPQCDFEAVCAGGTCQVPDPVNCK